MPSFNGPAYFGLEEMHLFGQGLGKTLFDLITISLKKSYNSSLKLIESDPELFPFYIEKQNLIEIGMLIENLKTTVPVSFNSKWVNPVKNSGGNRTVDYFNFSLYQLPTCFVPFFVNKRSKKSVLNLVKACQLCLKWSIMSEELKTIKKYFEEWVLFLKQEVERENIGSGVLKPTQHYLLHVEYMIQQNGPLRASSARSMERAIGKYKKLVKSKSSVGENAGNVLIRLANRSYISNLPWSISEAVNLLAARPYDENAYENHPKNPCQLWEPFFKYSMSSLPFGIDASKMCKALKNFHIRYIPTGLASFLPPIVINAAARAWGYNKVFLSRLYADHKNEHRRGNAFVMFYATHKK